MLKDGYFCLRAESGSSPDADAAFQEFYREKGAVRIHRRVPTSRQRWTWNQSRSRLST